MVISRTAAFGRCTRCASELPVRSVCMGIICSHRRISAKIASDSDDNFEDWHLVTTTGEIDQSSASSTDQNPGGRLQSLSAAQKRWIRARIKIKLLRRFRVLWSRTGSWLNLHPVGTVDQKIRQKASRVWASQGRAVLARFNTKDLFSPLTRRPRDRS